MSVFPPLISPMCPSPSSHRQRRRQGYLPLALPVRLCWLLAALVCSSNIVWLLARAESLDPTTLITAPISAVPGWVSEERSPTALGKTVPTAPTPYSRLAHRLVAGRHAQSTAAVLRRADLLAAISKHRVLHRKVAPASASDDPLLGVVVSRAFYSVVA